MPNRAERRASGAKYPDSLDAWAHDKLVSITLEAVGDGPPRQVDYELPDLPLFATRGMFPNPLLREMALRIEAGLTPSKLEPEEVGTYFDLMCWVIAKQLRKPDLVEMCGSMEAATAWVAEQMPPLHRIAIWQRSVHIFGPDDLLKFFEMFDEDGQLKEVQGQDAASLTDLDTFRGEPGGTEVPAGVGTPGTDPE